MLENIRIYSISTAICKRTLNISQRGFAIVKKRGGSIDLSQQGILNVRYTGITIHSFSVMCHHKDTEVCGWNASEIYYRRWINLPCTFNSSSTILISCDLIGSTLNLDKGWTYLKQVNFEDSSDILCSSSTIKMSQFRLCLVLLSMLCREWYLGAFSFIILFYSTWVVSPNSILTEYFETKFPILDKEEMSEIQKKNN